MRTAAAFLALTLLAGCSQAQLDNFRDAMQAEQEQQQEQAASQPQVVYVQQAPQQGMAFQPYVEHLYVPPPQPRMINTNCYGSGQMMSCQSY